MRLITFMHSLKHRGSNKRHVCNRLSRTRRILRRPIEQQRSSEDGSRDGRDYVPPGSTGPQQSRQGDHDIRHNKEERPFRKAPEQSQRDTRHPIEPIDPLRLRA
jgi:hypothetical protein